MNVKVRALFYFNIFDEIQFFPRARQAIKHLVKDGRYDYIETGSLISIKKKCERYTDSFRRMLFYKKWIRG